MDDLASKEMYELYLRHVTDLVLEGDLNLRWGGVDSDIANECIKYERANGLFPGGHD